MKKLTLLLIILLPVYLFSQGLYNNGARIVVTSGSYIYIDGDANGDFTNASGGQVDIDGVMILEGDFTNNAANNVFTNVDTDGEVKFAGGTQTITSALPNYTNFEKVTINNGSSTTLAAGSGMTVNGVFDVDGTFTSATPANEGTGGSLITATGTGAITGSGTININRFFKVNGRWQYLSVPMTNQLSDLFTETTASGNFNPNLYTYNEAFDQTQSPDPDNTNYSNYDYGSGYNFWQAWTQVQSTQGSPVTLNPAVGYICYSDTDLSTVFTTGAGNPDRLNNDAYYSPAVSYTSNDNDNGQGAFYDGWNLIGNPYQSALDWNNSNWTKTNILNTVYMWDGDNGNYIYYNNGFPEDHLQGNGQTLNSDLNGKYIPAMQSFMVKATANNPVLTIPSQARVHNSNQMYKGEQTKPDFDFVKLQIETNDQYDQTLVRFFENASESIEDNVDAYKAYATTPGLPQIYSIAQNTSLAINTLPVNQDVQYKMIPLGIVAKQDGQYNFTFKDFNYNYFDKFYLVHLYESNNENIVYTDLSLTPEYSVYLEEGEYKNNFWLIACSPFYDITNIFENTETVLIYSSNSSVFITISNTEFLNGQVQIFDALGRNVFSDNANSNFNQYNLNVMPGIYLVKYITKDNTFVRKVSLY